MDRRNLSCGFLQEEDTPYVLWLILQKITMVNIPLKDIAKRQEISEKYLESIMVTMSKTGIIKGLRGKGGGYKLALDPMDITVGRILKVTEKSLAPVSCLEMQPNLCKRSPACKTVRVWQEMYRVVDEYIESVTIADLVDEIDSSDFYVI